jgi:hypothetical protein
MYLNFVCIYDLINFLGFIESFSYYISGVGYFKPELLGIFLIFMVKNRVVIFVKIILFLIKHSKYNRGKITELHRSQNCTLFVFLAPRR